MFKQVIIVVLLGISFARSAPAAKPAPNPTFFSSHIHYSEPVVISYDSLPLVYDNYVVPEVVAEEYIDGFHDIDYHHHIVV